MKLLIYTILHIKNAQYLAVPIFPITALVFLGSCHLWLRGIFCHIELIEHI
jgi:hypothetical protein